jgi:hypothetical protein
MAVLSDENSKAAFTLLEIALLVTLTSEDNGVSQLAAKGLRYLAYLETVGNLSGPIEDDDFLSKRHLVYEQLGDPRVLIVGTCPLSYPPLCLPHDSFQAGSDTKSGYGKRCVYFPTRLRSTLRSGKNAIGVGLICTTLSETQLKT